MNITIIFILQFNEKIHKNNITVSKQHFTTKTI